ncbi:unnamed protein product [Leptidea sinapis]|uniref:Uncharacterized protein n=1 Tax=Leptidea sinapis TaxID=189913 RepID=A0A5E4Q7Y4_9NEOP|nr:unnamed protein product [Leptidea sinapis]
MGAKVEDRFPIIVIIIIIAEFCERFSYSAMRDLSCILYIHLCLPNNWWYTGRQLAWKVQDNRLYDVYILSGKCACRCCCNTSSQFTCKV